MSLFSDMQKEEDDKAYAAGAKAGQEGSWFTDLVHTATSPFAFGRYANVFGKGYDWGASHRNTSKVDSSSDEEDTSSTDDSSYDSHDDSSTHSAIATRSKHGFGSIFAFAYWGLIALIWVWYFKLSLQYPNNPQAAIDHIMSFFARMWSPTSDPVANVLIDAVLIVFYGAVLVGMLISGFYLLIAALCVGVFILAAIALVYLSQVSTTGAVVSVLLGIGLLYIAVKLGLRGLQWVSNRFF